MHIGQKVRQLRTQRQQATVTIGIAQNVIEAFRPDQPYQFPMSDSPKQTYKAFSDEQKLLAALKAQYTA